MYERSVEKHFRFWRMTVALDITLMIDLISQLSALLAIMVKSGLIYSVLRLVKSILVHGNQKQNCYVEQTSILRRDSHCRVVFLVLTDLSFKWFTGVKWQKRATFPQTAHTLGRFHSTL